MEEAGRLNEAGYPAPLSAWQGHLRAVADEAAKRESARVGGLSNELGYHLDMVADYEGARVAYQRALDIWEKGLEPEHPNVAAVVNNLGGVYRNQGELSAARDAYQRAYEIFQKFLGEEHPNTRIARENLEALEAGGE